MEIVSVQIKDVQSLQEISIETYVKAFGEFNTPKNMEFYLENAFNLERLKKAIAHPESHFFFIKKGDIIVGYLKLNVGDAQTEHLFPSSLEIERIYILPEHIGNGIGQQLLKYGIDFARNLEKEFVWLGVWEHNPRATRFYERNGFVTFDQHPYMMGDDEQTDKLMKLVL